MNYIKHLTGFFNKIHNETTLNPTHISLYLALFQCWNVNRFRNPTAISREEIMKASKINSKATYHKCMKELELLEFMEYNPTFNPHSCSTVTMVNFAKEIKTTSKIQQPTLSKNEPLHNLTQSNNEQLIEQLNELLYIYNKKQTVENISNNTKIDIEKISGNEAVQNLNPLINPKEKEIKTESGRQILPVFTATNKKQTESGQPKEKSCAKKEKPIELDLIFDTTTENQTENSLHKLVTSSHNFQQKKQYDMTSTVSPRAESRGFNVKNVNGSEIEKPSLEMVQQYFSLKESSSIEANKFFNYYSSIGWLIGGKTKMKDWKAAARNWMLNTTKFAANTPKYEYNSQPKPMHLHTPIQKNYDEPL